MRHRLAIGAMAVSIGLLLVAGVNHPWLKVYGPPESTSAAVSVGFGNQACAGVEVWGHPGFFGSITDAGACDY